MIFFLIFFFLKLGLSLVSCLQNFLILTALQVDVIDLVKFQIIRTQLFTKKTNQVKILKKKHSGHVTALLSH